MRKQGLVEYKTTTNVQRFRKNVLRVHRFRWRKDGRDTKKNKGAAKKRGVRGIRENTKKNKTNKIVN
jgi:hypothetical protein